VVPSPEVQDAKPLARLQAFVARQIHSRQVQLNEELEGLSKHRRSAEFKSHAPAIPRIVSVVPRSSGVHTYRCKGQILNRCPAKVERTNVFT
jgi:hypothetical protein